MSLPYLYAFLDRQSNLYYFFNHSLKTPAGTSAAATETPAAGAALAAAG